MLFLYLKLCSVATLVTCEESVHPGAYLIEVLCSVVLDLPHVDDMAAYIRRVPS